MRTTSSIIKIIILGVFFSASIFSQSIDEKVRGFVNLIESGEIDKVETESEELITANPNHPGILYLQGRLSVDGLEAVKFYQMILDNFPKSEWADDALYYTYQYYYAIGLYRTADLKMQHLKKEYPNSPYLSLKTSEDIKVQIENEKEKVPKEEPIQPIKTQIPTPKVEEPVTKETKPTTVGNYTIQVGAFSTLINAEKQKKFLEERGYQVEIVNRVRSGKKLFLVWAGHFNSAEEAVKSAYDIKQKYNIETITVQRY